ncbi:response regulator transcription factor [Bacillus timonensis]|nr:response regulator transcription factor [Bacillus timonensis]
MSYTIYLVEDEENLNQILTTYLKNAGWQVETFKNGQSAQAKINSRPHLWILDIMLPDIDGYQLIKEIKAEQPDVPVIFISARDAELDRVIGLEMGSDDYLSKPFLPKELVIRTKKLLERTYGKFEKVESAEQYGLYLIDVEKRMVFLQDQEITLTSKEFDLVVLFSKNIGQAFSREQILMKLWDENYFGSDRVIDDLVRRVRKKLPQLRIETIYGYGYRALK